MIIEATFEIQRRSRGGRKVLAPPSRPMAAGRIPRVAKLMALAIRFEGLIRAGDVRDYAELAQLGHVTRARISQVMNLLLLAPDIQEEVLFLPLVERGRDAIHLALLRPLVATVCWGVQRRLWQEVKATTASLSESEGIIA